jgi:hypothetical protein
MVGYISERSCQRRHWSNRGGRCFKVAKGIRRCFGKEVSGFTWRYISVTHKKRANMLKHCPTVLPQRSHQFSFHYWIWIPPVTTLLQATRIRTSSCKTREKRTGVRLNFSGKQLMSSQVECHLPFIRSQFKKIESSWWLGGARGKRRRRCDCSHQSAVSMNVTNVTWFAQLLQQLRMFRARFDDARQPKVGGRQPRKLQRRAARTIFRCLCFLRERVHMGSWFLSVMEWWCADHEIMHLS